MERVSSGGSCNSKKAIIGLICQGHVGATPAVGWQNLYFGICCRLLQLMLTCVIADVRPVEATWRPIQLHSRCVTLFGLAGLGEP